MQRGLLGTLQGRESQDGGSESSVLSLACCGGDNNRRSNIYLCAIRDPHHERTNRHTVQPSGSPLRLTAGSAVAAAFERRVAS